MACVIAFDLFYPRCDFAALMVNLPNMLIPAKYDESVVRIVLLSLFVMSLPYLW